VSSPTPCLQITREATRGRQDVWCLFGEGGTDKVVEGAYRGSVNVGSRMFHIDLQGAPLAGPDATSRSVVDVERGVVLQRVSGQGQVPNAEAMLMSWQGRLIPFDTRFRSAGGHYIVDFDSFGVSYTVKLRVGILQYVFPDAEAQREAQLLAVEALLVYGEFFNGLSKPDGHCRVEFEGRQWVLSDFGHSKDASKRW